MSVPVTAMVVDDEFFFRQLLRDILEKGGVRVIAEAANGNEAVAKYRECKPVITFMDIFMPEKNGLDAIREIMAIDPTARILVCSALGFDPEIEAARASGARELVMKPFLAEEIMQTVKMILS